MAFMHELSVISSIINTVVATAKKEEVTKVHSIELVIGAMNDYEEDWMQKYFDQLSPGTMIEGARLVIEKAPIIFKCNDCGNEFEFDAHGTDDCTCTNCHGINFKMISGRQMEIKNMTCE